MVAVLPGNPVGRFFAFERNAKPWYGWHMDTPPTHPAEHAQDFSRRYAEDLEIVAGQVMMDLGIPDDQMGARSRP